jgi:hypothetical protein
MFDTPLQKMLRAGHIMNWNSRSFYHFIYYQQMQPQLSLIRIARQYLSQKQW